MSTPKRNLTGAAAIVMSSIVVSRITGFFREMLIPNVLGAREADAYVMAFKITDLMYNMLVGGAIAAALIPVLAGYIEKRDEEEGWKAVGTFINVVFLSMAGVCLLGMIFARKLVPFIAMGFQGEATELTIRLTRILFPSVSFIMLAGLVNGVLNSYHRFAASAYGPTLYNIGGALSLLFLNRYGVEAVAVGVMCSSLLYFLFQLTFAMKNLKFYRFRIYLHHPGFRRLFKLAIPSLASSSIVQVNVIVSAMFVTLFGLGSVNAFNMADRTWQMPYGIFAQGIGIAMLPTLSAKLAMGDLDDYRDILMKGLKTVLFLSIPSAVGFVVLKDSLIRGIFQWTGSFNKDLVPIAGSILMFFSIAMLTQSIVAIMNRAFYAGNDTKTPLYVGASTILVNLVLSYSFYRFTDLGVSGMALSYSITSALNALLLLGLLNRKFKGIHLDKLMLFLLKVLPASAIMGIFLCFSNAVLNSGTGSKLLQLAVLGAEILAGAFLYFLVLALLKLDEALNILNIAAQRLKKLSAGIVK